LVRRALFGFLVERDPNLASFVPAGLPTPGIGGEAKAKVVGTLIYAVGTIKLVGSTQADLTKPRRTNSSNISIGVGVDMARSLNRLTQGVYKFLKLLSNMKFDKYFRDLQIVANFFPHRIFYA
jgi:hypothetical protein